MRRFVATTALLAAAATLGVTGCAAISGPDQRAVEAKAAIADVTALDKDPAERGDGWRRHKARMLLRRGTLHGEVVVETKDGTKTIVIQRGTVTAIDAGSMTVKSADGFTMTWTFGDKLRVVERRAAVQPEQVEVGARVGVAGTKDGDRAVARRIIIHHDK